jgi:hypothetical protein
MTNRMNVDIVTYCLRHDWVLGANDPDWVGWFTMIAYLIAASSCYLAGRVVPKGSARCGQPEQWFWFGLAVMLVALGFNKQLDLQTPFLGLSKHLAMAEGWYRERRVIQWTFIACMALAAGSIVIWACWKLRRLWRDYWLAYAGIILLLGFVLFRASPIQRVNFPPWPNGTVPGKKHMLELAGIACIGIAGLISRRGARSSN